MTEPQWDAFSLPEEVAIGRFTVRTKRTSGDSPAYPIFALRSAGQSKRLFVSTTYGDHLVHIDWAPQGKKIWRSVKYFVVPIADWRNGCGASRRCDSLEEAFEQIPDVMMEVML